MPEPRTKISYVRCDEIKTAARQQTQTTPWPKHQGAVLSTIPLRGDLMLNRDRNITSSRNRLSDRDMMLDVLTSAKSLSHLYNYALMESVDTRVRDTFKSLQQSEQQLVQTLFEIMQNEGWYATSRSNVGQRLEQTRRHSNYSERQASGRYSSAASSRQINEQSQSRDNNYQPAQAMRTSSRNRLDNSSENWKAL
jgi:spore coat protein CotF